MLRTTDDDGYHWVIWNRWPCVTFHISRISRGEPMNSTVLGSLCVKHAGAGMGGCQGAEAALVSRGTTVQLSPVKNTSNVIFTVLSLSLSLSCVIAMVHCPLSVVHVHYHCPLSLSLSASTVHCPLSLSTVYCALSLSLSNVHCHCHWLLANNTVPIHCHYHCSLSLSLSLSLPLPIAQGVHQLSDP